MEKKQGSGLRGRIAGSKWTRPAVIISALVLGAVIMCLIVLAIYASVARTHTTASQEDAGYAAPALGREPMPAEEVEKLAEMPAMEPAAPPASAVDTAFAAERLIIRSGNITMDVEDTLATQASIEAMVTSMASEGAFVVSSEAYGGTEGSQPFVTMSIRIPATRFDQIMDRLAELAVQVTSRNESAQDVTEEYVDLEARLESLEAARLRLLEIMQEARSTKDLLEAEQQLTQREAEIESIKGRMQYLEQSARLSSIWIELRPYILSQPVADQWRPAETARRAVEALVNGLRGFGDFTIVFAIAVLPWLAAIVVVVFLVVRLIRWRTRVRRDRRAVAGDTPDPGSSEA